MKISIPCKKRDGSHDISLEESILFSRYFVHFSVFFFQMNPKVIERKMDSDSEKNIDEDEGNLQNTAF